MLIWVSGGVSRGPSPGNEASDSGPRREGARSGWSEKEDRGIGAEEKPLQRLKRQPRQAASACHRPRVDKKPPFVPAASSRYSGR